MTDEAGATPGWPCARPLVKWAGGKRGELDVIGRALPTRIGRLLEPFAGGGAVLFAAPACIPAEANDLCADLTLGEFVQGTPALALRREAVFAEAVAEQAAERRLAASVADRRQAPCTRIG